MDPLQVKAHGTLRSIDILRCSALTCLPEYPPANMLDTDQEGEKHGPPSPPQAASLHTIDPTDAIKGSESEASANTNLNKTGDEDGILSSIDSAYDSNYSIKEAMKAGNKRSLGKLQEYFKFEVRMLTLLFAFVFNSNSILTGPRMQQLQKRTRSPIIQSTLLLRNQVPNPIANLFCLHQMLLLVM